MPLGSEQHRLTEFPTMPDSATSEIMEAESVAASSGTGAAAPAAPGPRGERKPEPPTLLIEPVGRWPGLNLRELWAYRELF